MNERPIFSKILIANRGEIAVRIIRSVKEMNIKTVAVYSDADEKSLHALIADEAYRLGPPPPKESYLNIQRIIEIALESGAEAIHPGYGFLAENPEFVEKIEKSGLTFIGPPSSVQRKVGKKLDTRRYLYKCGIPVVPGSFKPLDLSEAYEFAKDLGYPIIVKPAAGGGGIGMSIVWNPNELDTALDKASKISSSTFGSPDVYIEKYFPGARHIEVQILADNHGNIIHLFERECSIQRRFQKIIEETPSPALTDELREKVFGYAIKTAKAISYVNAGTIEFLYNPHRQEFFLLEINSRIQVEHPITEMTTGIDIVKEQIKIAAGFELEYKQNDITRRGHAIEARIYAEDPLNNFLPSPGYISRLYIPSGPWTRVDNGIYEGCNVPPYYDPLLFKLIVWGRDREEAINRLMRSLREVVIEGIKHNVPLHLAILNDKDFREGHYSTRYLSEKNFREKMEEYRHKIKLPRHKKKEVQKVISQVDVWRFAAKSGL